MVKWVHILGVNVELYIFIHFLCCGLFLTTQTGGVKEAFRSGALPVIHRSITSLVT